MLTHVITRSSSSHPAAPSLIANRGAVRTKSTSPTCAPQGRHGSMLSPITNLLQLNPQPSSALLVIIRTLMTSHYQHTLLRTPVNIWKVKQMRQGRLLDAYEPQLLVGGSGILILSMWKWYFHTENTPITECLTGQSESLNSCHIKTVISYCAPNNNMASRRN